jgi:hypothetical protein
MVLGLNVSSRKMVLYAPSPYSLTHLVPWKNDFVLQGKYNFTEYLKSKNKYNIDIIHWKP